MKLASLSPQFRQGEPVWGDTDDFAKAVAIEFDCPGCVGTPFEHRIFAPFLGRYPTEGPAWSASGSGYHDLTFSDAGAHTRSIRVNGGCRSHFNVTNGAIDFYGDSGHTQPRERRVTETTGAEGATKGAEGETTGAEGATKEAAAATSRIPPGHVKTHHLKFIDGILHQLHLLEEPGQAASEHWEPIEGQASTKDQAAGEPATK